MKELSIEEKAKRYDEAIQRAKNIVNSINVGLIGKDSFEAVFPELKESEDEKIRKVIIEHFAGSHSSMYPYKGFTKEQILAWLEKQGEQKPADNVEPKFHEGEWVVFNNKHQSIYQVEKIENGYYTLRHIHGGTFRVCVLHDESLRLWTIQDAKDGDVLTASDGSIFLFAGMVDYACKHYVALTTDGVINFNEGLEYSWETSRAVQPATKEQRDRLEKAMADAGYEWDAEKKKLKKIGQIPANSAKTCKDAQNPAWSEDDEKLFNSALWHIKNSCGNGGKNSGEFEVYNWVKSLKDRVQPNQEWSEEDNRILHAIRNALNYEKPRNYLKSRDLEFLEVLDWLKSLRPQNRWKPSEEQMDALSKAIAFVFDSNSDVKHTLESLYGELKKL